MRQRLFLLAFSTVLLASCAGDLAESDTSMNNGVTQTPQNILVDAQEATNTVPSTETLNPPADKVKENNTIGSPAVLNAGVSTSTELPEEVKPVNKPNVALTESDLNSVTAQNTNGIPVMQFEKTKINFGEIEEGETITRSFTFKNIGNADLVIETARASCGCTEPSFPFIPIAPGETGTIGVMYDSKGKKGKQIPTIQVTSNSVPKNFTLYLEGEVLVEGEEEEEEEKKEEEKKGEEEAEEEKKEDVAEESKDEVPTEVEEEKETEEEKAEEEKGDEDASPGE